MERLDNSDLNGVGREEEQDLVSLGKIMGGHGSLAKKMSCVQFCATGGILQPGLAWFGMLYIWQRQVVLLAI